MTDKMKLAENFFNFGCIQFGKFRLKMHETNPDAPLSPIYFNFRIIRSYPDLLEKTAKELIRKSEGLEFDLIGDVPTSATPIATLMSYFLKIPLVSPRKETKTTGTKKDIDGVYKSGQKILLIDDLITRANSKIEAKTKLEAAGLLVSDIVVIVDREQGGEQELARNNITLHKLFTINELMGLYLGEGKISEQQYNEVIEYLNSSK